VGDFIAFSACWYEFQQMRILTQSTGRCTCTIKTFEGHLYFFSMGSVNFFTRSDLLFQRSRMVFFRSQAGGTSEKNSKKFKMDKN